MTIQQLLDLTISRNASDLHLVVGFQPLLRIHGDLFPVNGSTPITPQEMESLILPILSPQQRDIYLQNLDFDFSLDLPSKARFRINLYRQKGFPAAALRLIPIGIPQIEDLGFPKAVVELANLRQGFVLVTGPTGHGKSTTLASFINRINHQRAAHIITVEDPVEYVYPVGKSLISQREMYGDTHSWVNALRSALREDPDVVLVGEMRDLETISAAMTIAETGHLVFTTLHTNSAAQSIDRIIDVFPPSQQPQVRLQLASTIEAIISLRLVPTITPGRTLATEILFASPAAKSMIREGKTHMIDNLIQTSGELGMTSIESSLASLVKAGKITADVAREYSLRPDLLNKLLR